MIEVLKIVSTFKIASKSKTSGIRLLKPRIFSKDAETISSGACIVTCKRINVYLTNVGPCLFISNVGP